MWLWHVYRVVSISPIMSRSFPSMKLIVTQQTAVLLALSVNKMKWKDKGRQTPMPCEWHQHQVMVTPGIWIIMVLLWDECEGSSWLFHYNRSIWSILSIRSTCIFIFRTAHCYPSERKGLKRKKQITLIHHTVFYHDLFFWDSFFCFCRFVVRHAPSIASIHTIQTVAPPCGRYSATITTTVAMRPFSYRLPFHEHIKSYQSIILWHRKPVVII